VTRTPTDRARPARVVRWRRVVDPAALAALAAIVIDTVSPVDDKTGQPTDPADPGPVQRSGR
jgi:hypothetical protein